MACQKVDCPKKRKHNKIYLSNTCATEDKIYDDSSSCLEIYNGCFTSLNGPKPVGNSAER